MKKNILLLFFILSVCASYAQVSMGILFEFRIADSQSKSSALDRYTHVGFQFKKPLSLKLNLVTGLTAKFYGSNIESISVNSDLITYLRDKSQTSYAYMNGNMAFIYASIPIGLEYKINTRFRLSYKFENNILLSTNKYANTYLEDGQKSVNPYMYTHSIAALFSGSGFSIGLGVTTPPQIIKTQSYNYNYMYDLSESIQKSYMLNLIFSYDFPLKKIKKIL